MEGIKAVKAKVATFIHPSRALDVPQGVHEILNSLLLRYSDEFEGVLLAYLAPKLVGRTAKILSGLAPYFHVNLTVNLLLFAPVPGMKIEGKVIKIEKDYIGVLVLGLFNSIIGIVDIPDQFDYSTEHHSGRAWVSMVDDRHTIELGSLIRFSVKSLQETEHIIDICGSLLEDDTGLVDWLEQRSFRSRSKVSKEEKMRSIEDEKLKRKKSKDRTEHAQELKKRPRELGQSHAKPINEILKADVGEPLIAPKKKKKKGMDLGKSTERYQEDKESGDTLALSRQKMPQ